jgi:hypothetical protein
MSRFGHDLKAGETARARTRLVIAPGISDDQAITLFQRYLKELSPQIPSANTTPGR